MPPTSAPPPGTTVPVFDEPSASSLSSVPTPATRLGRYAIAGRIATGGMATVYLARLTAVGGFAREFALKVIHPHLAEQPGFRERFHREARLASRIRHPNVVTTIDAGDDAGYCYMALELIEGGTLRQLVLQRNKPFPPAEAAQIIAEVARGLHALHMATDEMGAALNVVHRDLAPHNIMLDRTGRPVLIDLGLAKADDNTALTQLGMLAGRLPYMSPEQARQDSLDARSDVFALGAVLCELVIGELPFGDTHDTATMERLQQGDLRPIAARMRAAKMPEWLTEIVLLCLQSDPADRFASAEALADALAQELTEAGYRVLETRQRLARIVEAALPELGTLAAMHALPVRIEADPSQPIGLLSGAHDVLAPRRIPAVAWALSGAVVGAVLLGGIMMLGDLSGEVTATTRAPPSLAPGTAPRSPRGATSQRPPPAAGPSPVRTMVNSSEDFLAEPGEGTGGPLHAETDGDPAQAVPETRRRRRRVARPKDTFDGLKPNPYATAK